MIINIRLLSFYTFIIKIAVFVSISLMLSTAAEADSIGDNSDRPVQRFFEKFIPPESKSDTPVILKQPPASNTKSKETHPEQALFFLKKVRLHGNTVISSEELASIIHPFENRKVTADDLRQLRQDISSYYIQKGYINSGAILPKQAISNGELRIDIIEGKLSQVQIKGLNHLREFYLRSRIARNADEKPLNVKELQENLQLLQQNPLIKRINAELAPGLKPGEAILRTHIDEARPYYVTVGYNNNGVPSVGSQRFEMWAGHRNLLGIGDAFSGNFNISQGQTQYAFDYAVPFTPWDTAFTTHYQHSEAKVIEKAFTPLNIFNQSDSIGIGISQPVWRTLENQLILGVTADWRHSKAFLLDQPYSFSRGAINGVSNVAVIRFSQDWSNHTDNRVLAFRSIFNWGIDALNATMHPSSDKLPDSRYFFWLGQTQWVQRLWDTGIEMHLQGNTQLSANPLLSLEQYALGGMYSVRGYRKNQIVRDNGFATTLEFRIPLFEGIIGKNVLHFAPFFDYGRSWYTQYPTPTPYVLASAGIGFHLDPVKQVHVEFYWAQPFRKINYTGYDLQDSGLNFIVNYSPF